MFVYAVDSPISFDVDLFTISPTDSIAAADATVILSRFSAFSDIRRLSRLA